MTMMRCQAISIESLDISTISRISLPHRLRYSFFTKLPARMVVQRSTAPVRRATKTRSTKRQAKKMKMPCPPANATKALKSSQAKATKSRLTPVKLPSSALSFKTLFASLADSDGQRQETQERNGRILNGSIKKSKGADSSKLNKDKHRATGGDQPVTASSNSLLPRIDLLPASASNQQRIGAQSQNKAKASSKKKSSSRKDGSSRSKAIELDTSTPNMSDSQVATRPSVPSWSPAFRKILNYEYVVSEPRQVVDDEAVKGHKRHHHRSKRSGKRRQVDGQVDKMELADDLKHRAAAIAWRACQLRGIEVGISDESIEYGQGEGEGDW